jgi:glycosyltransferase involved in cell wall biosynthesis
MRILFVHDRLGYSGATSYSLDLARSLLGRGDELKLCSTGGPRVEDFQREGVETYVARSDFFSFRALLRFLREFDPDLIHVQDLSGVTLGRRLAQRLRRPYGVTVHHRPTRDAPSLEDRQLCGVIVTGEEAREALVNEHGLPKNLLRIIPRGVDTDALRPDAAAGGDSPPSRLPVVGCVGALHADRGQSVLLRAARELVDRGIEAHFVLAGEGKEEPRLRRWVKDLGLQLKVIFSPPLGSLPHLFSLFDVVALPAPKGDVGVTALEAMAMARPVVASGAGEVLSLVEDGTTGFLVTPDDPAALAARLAELLADCGLRDELGGQARTWVEENRSLGPMVDATSEFYREALAGTREAPRPVPVTGSGLWRVRS